MLLKTNIVLNAVIHLKPEAHDEIKYTDEQKFIQFQQKHEQDMNLLKEEMNNKFTQILSLIQQNPILANVKPEVLERHPK